LVKLYKFLAHTTFLELAHQLLENHPSLKKKLNKQIEKATADPFNAGSPMRRIQHPDLQGCVYKLWIGGRKEARMIYFVYRKKSIVFGVYVSPTVRKKFDYDKFPWLQNAIEIYNDFIKGDLSKFRLVDPAVGI